MHAAVRRHAVDDRAHRVLAHAEVQVASGVAPAAAGRALRVVAWPRRRIEVAQALERGVGRRIEVRRAAGQRRQLAARWHSSPCRDASRVAMPLASAGKTGMSASQPCGQLRHAGCAAARRQAPGTPSRTRPSVACQPSSSRAPRASASRKCASASSGIRNGGSFRPAELLLGQRHFLRRRAASRAPRSCPACAASRSRCACAPGSATAASVSARARLQRGVDRGDVVAVRDRLHVPAVGLEARARDLR